MSFRTERVFKTLIVELDGSRLVVAVVPVPCALDLGRRSLEADVVPSGRTLREPSARRPASRGSAQREAEQRGNP